MIDKIEKIPLEVSFKERWKLYLFIVRPRTHGPVKGEYMTAVGAYRVEDAMSRALKDNITPDNGLGIIYTNNKVDVAIMLNDLNITYPLKTVPLPKISEEIKIKPGMVIPVAYGWDSWIAGMMMGAEELLEDSKDIKKCKAMIKKFKRIKK